MFVYPFIRDILLSKNFLRQPPLDGDTVLSNTMQASASSDGDYCVAI